MSVEDRLQAARELLGTWVQEELTFQPERVDVIIEKADLLAAIQAVIDVEWGYLITITGVDLGVEDGRLEVLYHFGSGAAVLTLRVRIPRGGTPDIPSVYHLIPSVSFYERELQEMFGIVVENTPNSDRLFLPEDWPDGVYPLRKDFSPEQAGL